MTQITVPDAAAYQLSKLMEPASICDATGKHLGTFLPGIIHDPEVYARNPSPLTPEERERRRKEGGGKTLAEFWDDMRQKHPDEFN